MWNNNFVFSLFITNNIEVFGSLTNTYDEPFFAKIVLYNVMRMVMYNYLQCTNYIYLLLNIQSKFLFGSLGSKYVMMFF